VGEVYNRDMTKEKRIIIGSTIWWTEGTKAYRDKRWGNTWKRNVDVTNTNPQIIQKFLEFLRNDIGIDEERLKLQLQIHQGDNQEEFETFWSEVTEIPKSRFTKTIIRPQGNKVGKSKGTCKIRYSDKVAYEKIEKTAREVLNIS
jgi:hypothetical protein